MRASAAEPEAARREAKALSTTSPEGEARAYVLIGELRQAAFYSQVKLTRTTRRNRLTTQPQRSDTRATRGGMMISAGT